MCLKLVCLLRHIYAYMAMRQAAIREMEAAITIIYFYLLIIYLLLEKTQRIEAHGWG